MYSFSRREFVVSLVVACSGLLSSDTLATGHPGLPVFSQSPQNLKTLSVPQWQALGAMADIIIPPTKTPGAKAVGVHDFIDSELSFYMDESAKIHFLNGLNSILTIVDDRYNKPFNELEPATQVLIMQKVVASKSPFKEESLLFFRQLKKMVVFAYYTSEEGASQELNYLPVPGGYDGKMKLLATSRSWQRSF